MTTNSTHASTAAANTTGAYDACPLFSGVNIHNGATLSGRTPTRNSAATHANAGMICAGGKPSTLYYNLNRSCPTKAALPA